MKAQPELKTNLGKSEASSARNPVFGSTLVFMHSNVSCMFSCWLTVAASLDHHDHGLHPQSIFICILNVGSSSS